MTTSTAHKQPLPWGTGTSRKRPQAATPDSVPPSKKPRSEPSKDSALDLALDHLRVDPPCHPLYQRNANFIINQALGDQTVEHVISDQIDKVLSHVGVKKINRKDRELNNLQHQLVMITAQRILAALGASLDEAFDFANWTENFEIQQDLDRCKLTLTVRPVLQVEDDEANDSAAIFITAPVKPTRPNSSQTNGTSKPNGGEVSEGSEDDDDDESDGSTSLSSSSSG